MKQLLLIVVATFCYLSSFSQNAPIYLFGTGLDGSTYHTTAIFSDATNGLLFEAPIFPNFQKAPIELNWRGGGIPGLKILGNGNVGLGLQNPSEKLEVAGRIKAGDRIYANSNEASTLSLIQSYNSAGGASVLRAYSGASYWDFGTNQSVAGNSLLIGPAINENANNAAISVLLNKNVGIGTLSPSEKLSVNGNLSLNGVLNTSEQAAAILGRSISMIYEADVQHIFRKNNGIEWMRLTNGNLGIGINNPSNKLEVNGTVRAKEVRVENTNWPDYVFEPNYSLRTLSNTAIFIKENKHLPEIPSAKEIKENGVNLGEMNALLLKKIEELTLHLINQQSQIDKQAKDIEKLKNDRLLNK